MTGRPLSFVCLVAALFYMISTGRAILADEEAARPDILLIMPDQMRGDCLSILGHPAVRTPTLDQLAQRGVLFRRAYSTVPSCIPARYAMLTGLYPQTSGVVGFRQKKITTPTMPQLLRDAGYATALVGREMHQSVGAAKLGYQTEIRGSTYIANDEYTADLKKAMPDMGEIRAWVSQLGLTYNHWQARPWPLTNNLHPTTWVVGKARSVIAGAAADKPLFLTASFYAPHPPLFPPAEYFDRYMQQKLPSPARGDWVDWDSLTPKGADGGHRVLLAGETLRRCAGWLLRIDRAPGPRTCSLDQRFYLPQRKGRTPVGDRVHHGPRRDDGRPWLFP